MLCFKGPKALKRDISIAATETMPWEIDVFDKVDMEKRMERKWAGF